jgi:hypothetical protein
MPPKVCGAEVDGSGPTSPGPSPQRLAYDYDEENVRGD